MTRLAPHIEELATNQDLSILLDRDDEDPTIRIRVK